MKKYDFLISVGCSFTEGGGLNSPKYHRYLAGDSPEIINNDCSGPTQFHNQYANYHSFPGYLSRMLECEFINLGKSRASNELIFKTLYKTVNDCCYQGNVLVTLQTTVLSRILLYVLDKNDFITINGFDNLSYDVEQFYRSYITHFFDRTVEYKKLLQNIDVYSSWLKNKNIDMVWIPYDTQEPLIENRVTINFGNNDSLLGFSSDNSLMIKDLLNIPYDDRHLTELGNKTVAKKIYEHISKYYND